MVIYPIVYVLTVHYYASLSSLHNLNGKQNARLNTNTLQWQNNNNNNTNNNSDS